ncbi:atrial natriuretic peptide receptor 2-like [Gigantopelta aegis]|uniref:atrial natriuretic peptide receptor 2-like n=1 Tax=Gigantopelta aegis TaxID=1735272 RepID=UPI001B88BFD8|nr:atrial natriuretic peptide receptor 2-like [Gigantopelta aegis]
MYTRRHMAHHKRTSVAFRTGILICLIAVVPNLVPGHAVRLNGAGASFPRDVYASWIPAYKSHRSKFKTLEMVYEALGSGVGQARIKGISGSPVEYAGSDSLLKSTDYELYPDLQMFPTMAGAVVLSFNLPGITSVNLTMDHVVRIYMGDIAWWNDTSIQSINPSVELPRHRIVPIARQDKSGTTEIFTTALSADPTWQNRFGIFNKGLDPNDRPYVWDGGVVKVYGQSTRGMAGMIVSIKYSVGYLVMSDAAISGLHYAYLQNRAGRVVTPSTASVQSSMDEFVASFDSRLTASLANPSSPGAYPIAGYTYMIVKLTTMEDCESAKELVRYIKWFYTHDIPRNDCEHLFMTPLSKKVYTLVLEHVLRRMTCKRKNIAAMVREEMAEEELSLQTWRMPVYVTAPLFGIVLLIVIPGYIVWKLTRTHWTILNNGWKVDYNTIRFQNKSLLSKQSLGNGYGSNKISPSYSTLNSSFSSSSASLFGDWGNCSVVLHEVFLSDSHLKYSIKKRVLWMMTKISHKNIASFYGLVDIDGVFHTLSEYSSKSSLAHFLRSSSLNATDDLKFAIAGEISSGMVYLHKNNIIHGQLSCDTCFFDVMWTLKICQWQECDIASLCKKNIVNCDFKTISKWDSPEFWTAPEIFQFGSNPTKSSDVYSFGVIMQEIFSRELPFVNCAKDKSPAEVLEQVVVGFLRPPFSPNMHITSRVLMESAWEMDPMGRPSFASLQSGIVKAFPKQRSIMDCIVRSLEQYVAELEGQVCSRTEDDGVAENSSTLQRPDRFDDVLGYVRGPISMQEYTSTTVMALDIQGIDKMADKGRIHQDLDVLRQFSSAWNKILTRGAKTTIFDVSTDGFKLVSGAPELSHDHVGLIARTAESLLAASKTILAIMKTGQSLSVRIGVATGSVMMGVEASLQCSQSLVIGGAVGEARMLADAAEPWTILISEKVETVLQILRKWSILQNKQTVLKDNKPIQTFYLVGSKDGLDMFYPCDQK